MGKPDKNVQSVIFQAFHNQAVCLVHTVIKGSVDRLLAADSH
jgi:hypothetical protein